MAFMSGLKSELNKVKEVVEKELTYTVDVAVINVKAELTKLEKFVEEKAAEEAEKLKSVKVLQDAITVIQTESKRAQDLIAKLKTLL